MTTEQKLTSATKRHQEMTDCLERLKKLCEEERDCDHGCPLAGYCEDGEVICTLVQATAESDFVFVRDCRNWSIKQWSE